MNERIPNIIFRQVDFMREDQPLTDYCDSVSCLHALEHFGLGRYGDPVDPDGHLKGFRNLRRIVQGGARAISRCRWDRSGPSSTRNACSPWTTCCGWCPTASARALLLRRRRRRAARGRGVDSRAGGHGLRLHARLRHPRADPSGLIAAARDDRMSTPATVLLHNRLLLGSPRLKRALEHIAARHDRPLPDGHAARRGAGGRVAAPHRDDSTFRRPPTSQPSERIWRGSSTSSTTP